MEWERKPVLTGSFDERVWLKVKQVGSNGRMVACRVQSRGAK